jgi:hypothetical protein
MVCIKYKCSGRWLPPSISAGTFVNLDTMGKMTSKQSSGPFLYQHPVAPLLVILAISLVCCLSVVGALLKSWLGQ